MAQDAQGRHDVQMLFYSKYCGPASVASVLGCSPLDAAKSLSAVKTPTCGWKSTDISTIGAVLGLPVKNIRRERMRQLDYPGKFRYKYLQTVAAFLRDHPDREAVLRGSHHFMHIRRGKIVEGNGHYPMRGRVTHVIWLDR